MTKEELTSALSKMLGEFEAKSLDLVKEDPQKNILGLSCLFGKIRAIKKLLKDSSKISIDYCKKAKETLNGNQEYILSIIKNNCKDNRFDENAKYYLFFRIGEENIFDFVISELEREDFLNFAVKKPLNSDNEFFNWIEKLDEQK